MWTAGWDQIFSERDWGRYPGEELIRFVARTFYRAPDRRALRFLEIGCGTGANLWYLAREGFTAVGLDGSAVALERAHGRFEEEGLQVELHRGDATALPFADASFDAVLDVECIYANVEADARKILDEVRRVLKPGGWLYSKTFADGTVGQETATPLEGEPNTYSAISGALAQPEDGVIRLTPEWHIPVLYAGFDDLQWEYLKRSVGNRSGEVSEWIVTGRKPGELP